MTINNTQNKKQASGKQSLKTYVLTLKRAEERQVEMQAQLDALGLDFEFFYGIDGGCDDHPYFQHYSLTANKRRRRNQMSRGEIACFISHRLLWEKCLARDEPVLILEDDAILSPDAQCVIPKILPYLQRWPFIKLSGLDNTRKTHHLGEVDGQHELRKWNKTILLTTAYLLTPVSARPLIECSKCIAEPVDNFIDRFYDHGIEQVSIYPFICTPGHIDSSTIAGRHNTSFKRTLLYKINKFSFNLVKSIQRHVHNWKFGWSHK